MLLVPAAIGAARYQSGELKSSLQISGLVLGALTIVAIYVVRAFRNNEVSDIDVSRREQRPRMFAIAISSTLVTLLSLWFLGQPASVLLGAGVALALLAWARR